MTTKVIRCAIYTRKSTDEGLDQEFNTLEAQREACEAYIKSQAHEGWRVITERYDDGGHSGGTLERPAMQRLLERVRGRRVDVILIYKIDRLTRSLADFAKLAEEFDQYGVSFVSVTQQFNTTTSMGRLMLNVLLSFAQFEREITGERIRDKIAASKKKGMWMGGSVPLGYDWRDRALIVNRAEAKTVRALYQLYLKHGNVRTVVSEASRLDLKTKIRVNSNGKRAGGKVFCRGHVYALLRNPIYIGKIPHRGEIYPATHSGIISDKDWQEVQKRLTQNRHQRAKGTNAKGTESLLTGLLFDVDGNRFTPTHTIKNGRRYRYYVEQALVTGERPASSKLRRIPAAEIEAVVRDGLANFLANPAQVIKAVGADLNTTETKLLASRAADFAKKLAELSHQEVSQVRTLLQRVAVSGEGVHIRLSIETLRSIMAMPPAAQVGPKNIDIAASTSIRSCGSQMKFVLGTTRVGTADLALLKLLAQAHDWLEQLKGGTARSIHELARREQKAPSYIARALRLAFLAPDIQEKLSTGRQPPEVTAKRLILREALPLDWEVQRNRLDISFP